MLHDLVQDLTGVTQTNALAVRRTADDLRSTRKRVERIHSDLLETCAQKSDVERALDDMRALIACTKAGLLKAIKRVEDAATQNTESIGQTTAQAERLERQLQQEDAKIAAVTKRLSGFEQRIHSHTTSVKKLEQMVHEQAQNVSVHGSLLDKVTDDLSDLNSAHQARLSQYATALKNALTKFDKLEKALKQSLSSVKPKFQTIEERLQHLSTAVAGISQTVATEHTDPHETMGAFQVLTSPFSEKELRIMTQGLEALKEWTNRTASTIVYDSNVDPFKNETMFAKVVDRPNIAVIAFTSEGDVFGGFYSVAVTEQCALFLDPTIFVFSFESRGRCETPQRFMAKGGSAEKPFVKFYKDPSDGWFVGFCGRLGLGNEQSTTYCIDVSMSFEGVRDTTLSGKNRRQGPFVCTRLVAVQLK